MSAETVLMIPGIDEEGAPAPTPTLELTGPSSGNCLEASTNFTVTITNPPSGDTVITFASTDGGDVFTPTTRTLNSGTLSATFTVTPDATSGARTISITNDRSISNPAGVSYTAAATALSILGANLVAHYRADMGTYQSSGGAAASADGDAVGEWQDISGNTRHVSQSTAGNKPTLQLNEINSLPTILFDAVDDYLTRANFQAGSSGAYVFVMKLSASPTNSTTPLCASDTAAANNFIRTMYRSTGTTWTVNQRNADTMDTVDGSIALSANTPYIMEVTTDGSAYAMKTNGSAHTMTPSGGSNTGDWAADTAGMDNFTIGAFLRNTLANPFKGHLAEVLVIEPLPASGVMDSLRTLLNSRYAAF
jgi:hypothetical protein